MSWEVVGVSKKNEEWIYEVYDTNNRKIIFMDEQRYANGFRKEIEK
jgi:IS1 family transposase